MVPDIKTGVIVTLTEWEQKVCEIQHNIQQKLKTKVEYGDIAADLAYCKHNNIYPYRHLDLCKLPWDNKRGDNAACIEPLAFYFEEVMCYEDLRIPTPSKISLNKLEQEVCNLIAPQRTKASRSAKLGNRKVDKTRTDTQVEVQGLGGEFAFCKLFNLYPNEQFTILARVAEDDYGDAILHNGLVVDVKSTEYHTGRLLIQPWKKGIGIDCYALMTGPFPEYTFRGFATKTAALHPDRIGKIKDGGKEGFITEQRELVELESLLKN